MNDQHFRRAVQWAAMLNLACFLVEFVVALHIGSVSLLADSADFFEDAAVNFLIFMALAWSAAQRARGHGAGLCSPGARARLPLGAGASLARPSRLTR
ncbi:cation transporter [Caulobacter sp. FWC2]|uniref:cation transporter n=1 Tax=Caulobacter sp. FWC2 TaxID=69664 RepID=UPI0018EE455A|nr:cation transporter [Caulobacter sp. FWC2]